MNKAKDKQENTTLLTLSLLREAKLEVQRPFLCKINSSTELNEKLPFGPRQSERGAREPEAMLQIQNSNVNLPIKIRQSFTT